MAALFNIETILALRRCTNPRTYRCMMLVDKTIVLNSPRHVVRRHRACSATIAVIPFLRAINR